MKERNRWMFVVLYAAAMAWVEAAVVLYMRLLLDRVQPYQIDPLPVSVGLGKAEVVREVSTLIMLWAVGYLAGRDRRSRLGYAMLTFGAWDILYYVFLVPLSGWPDSLLDWDILFLIPLPWWGPVLAPASIAFMMVITGTLITQFQPSGRWLWPRWPAWLAGLAGACMALYTFMTDALRALGEGPIAVRQVLPVTFNWPLFGLALLLLSMPIIDLVWQLWLPLSLGRVRYMSGKVPGRQEILGR